MKEENREVIINEEQSRMKNAFSAGQMPINGMGPILPASFWQRLTAEKNLKRIFFTFLIGQIPLGIVVALLTPDDILANPVARYFTDFMSSIVPLVRETGIRTTVPATQFIAAVLYISAIVCSSVLALGFIKTKLIIREQSIQYFKNMQEKHPVINTLLVIFFLLVPLYFYIVPYEKELTRKQAHMLSSKIFMGTYGAGLILSLCLGAVLGLLLLYLAIKYINYKYCSSESKNEKK